MDTTTQATPHIQSSTATTNSPASPTSGSYSNNDSNTSTPGPLTPTSTMEGNSYVFPAPPTTGGSSGSKLPDTTLAEPIIRVEDLGLGIDSVGNVNGEGRIEKDISHSDQHQLSAQNQSSSTSSSTEPTKRNAGASPRSPRSPNLDNAQGFTDPTGLTARSTTPNINSTSPTTTPRKFSKGNESSAPQSSRAISSSTITSSIPNRSNQDTLGLGLMPGLKSGTPPESKQSSLSPISTSSQSISSLLESSKRPSFSDDPYGTHTPSPIDTEKLKDWKYTPPNSGAHTPITQAFLDTKRSEFLAHPLTSPSNPGGINGAVGEKVPFTDSTTYWLTLYFMFNLGLTLFNKALMYNFPFPYTLTGLHALSGTIGCYFALERGAFTPARLTSKENLIMGAFSVLYTINIAVSNVSLQLVTIPFHQVVRASTPLFTIMISILFFRGKFSLMKLVSLLPVIAGVGFATYGDYYFTAWGLILTLLGTFLAAMKTVVTNVIQTGGGGRLKLHPLDLLMRMSPLAFIQCVIFGWLSGELEQVRRYGAREMTGNRAMALAVNGMIAFGLNVVSFSANKKAGALTMTVAANCKQVLTIVIAVFLFNLKINFTNGIGIMLTLIGGGWYGWIEFQEKNKKARLGRPGKA